ncbi:MAG TPA: ABC transporter permease [Bacteroidales bacterium]|nr:ABC transporter permease [Bacteroidales bacterium]
MKSILLNILKVARRETERMLSRKLYILTVLIFPVATILFFCSLMKEGVPTKMPIAVVDLDNTATSRKMARNIDVTPLSDVVMNLQSEKEAMSALKSGKIYGFIVLPENLQSDIMTSRQPIVRYYYHNGLFIAGGLLRNDFASMTNTLSAGISLQRGEMRGLPEIAVMSQIQPVQLCTHLLFNPTANYPTYVTTIILPIMLQIFILMITVYCIGIEIKEKTSREWLKASGKSVVVALTGKLLPYTVIFLVLMMFQNFMVYKILMVPMHAGIGCITMASLLFILAYQAIGIFCIGLLPLMRHSLNLAAFYGILALSLCGFSFPTESMSPVFQLWAYGFPVRHYMHIFQSQVLAGFGWVYSAGSFISLVAFLLLPLVIINRLKSALIYQNFIENIHKTDALAAQA